MIVFLVLVFGAIFARTLHMNEETLQRTETNLNQSPFNINKFATLIENHGKEQSHTIYNTTDRKKRTIEKNCNNKLNVNNTIPNKFLKKANIQLTEENLPLQKQVRRETSQLDEDDEASDITDDIKNKTFEQNTTKQLSSVVKDSESNEPHLRRTGHYPGIDVDEGINDKKLLVIYPTRTTLNLAFEEHKKKFHKTVDVKGKKFELLPFYAANADENIDDIENIDTPAREIYEKTPIDGDFTNKTKSTTTETIYYEDSLKYEKGEGEFNERVKDKDDASDKPVNTTSGLFYKIKKVIFDEEKDSLPHNVLDDSKQDPKGDEEKSQQQNTKSAKDDDFDNDTEKDKDMDLKPASDLEKNAKSEKDSEKDESDEEEFSDFEFEKDKNIDEVLDNNRGKPAEREKYRDDSVDIDKDTNIGVKLDVELNKNREEEIEPRHQFSIVSNRKAFDDENSLDGLPLRDSLPNYPIRPYYDRYSQGKEEKKEVLKRTTRDYSVRTRKLNHRIFVDEVARPYIDLDIFDDSDNKNKLKTSVHANISHKTKTFKHPSYNEKERWNVTPKKENKNMVSTTEKDYEYYDNDTETKIETKRINRVKQKTILNRIPSSIDKNLMKIVPTKKIPQYDKARQEMSMHRKIITPRTSQYEKVFTTESVDAAYIAIKPIKNYSHKNNKKENFVKSLPDSTKELHLLKPLSPSLVTLQEKFSNNTSTIATQKVVYKATPPTFFKNTIKKKPNIPKMKFRKSQVIQKNKSYNKVHKAQTTTSSSSATSSSTSSSSLSVIIETTPRTTTKKSIKKYPQKPKLGLITKNFPVSKTFTLDKKESKIDKHNLTSTTLATTTKTQTLKHYASTYNIPVFNHTEHTKDVNSIDKSDILSTTLTDSDYSSTVITTRKIRVPNLKRSTSTNIPKIYENTLPVTYHNKVIPLKKSQREKNLKTTINVTVKSTLNTVTTTEMEGEYEATPASNAQFVSYLPKNKTDSPLLNNDLEEAKKNNLNASECVSCRVLSSNETIRAKNNTESSKNLQSGIDQNMASTVGFYKHNKLFVHDRPKSEVYLQVISTPNSLNPKPESVGEGYEDYDDIVGNDNNINDESMYTTKSLIWTTSTKGSSIVQPKKSTMRDQKASANVSKSVAESVLNILLKKKPAFSKNYIQNVSNDKAYSNKIMSLYKALIQTSLDVLLDKSTYNKTWYKIANSTENPRNETNILEEETVARLFDETFSKGIYSNINFYHVDNTSKTGENDSSPAQNTKYVEEFDVSNVVEDRDDKFDNEHIFEQPDGYAYDYPRTKTVVETILNIILNKSIARNNNNRTHNTDIDVEDRNVKSSPIYKKVIETVLNKFLNKSRNSSKEVFEKNTEKISTTSDPSADRLFIKKNYTNHTVNNDSNSTSYLKALSSNFTLYETSTGKEITLHVASFEDNKNYVEQNKTLPTNTTLDEANSKGTTLEKFTQVHNDLTVINPLRNKTLLNRVTETPLELTTGLETAVNKPIIDVIYLTTISPSTKEFTRTDEAFLERINALATNKIKNEKMPLFEIINFDKDILHDSKSMTSSPLFDKEEPHTTSTTGDDHKSTAKKYNVTLPSNSTIVTKTTVTEMSVHTSTTKNETIAYFKFLNTGTTVLPIRDSESHVHDTESVSHSQNCFISAKNCIKNEQDVTVKTTVKNDTKNENNILNTKQNRTEKENITHETENDKMNKELHQGYVNKTLLDDVVYTTSEIAKEYITTETTTTTTNDEVYTTFEIAKEYATTEMTTITKSVNTASEKNISSSITTAITSVKDANVTENKEFQNMTVTDISEKTYSQLNETVPTHYAIANETTTNIVLNAEYLINNNEYKYSIEMNTSEVKDLKTSSIKPTDTMQSSSMPFLNTPDATNDSVREFYNTSATLDNLLQGTKASQTWTLKDEDRQLDIFPSERTNNTNEPYPSITSAATIVNIFLQNGSKLNETDKKSSSQIYYSVLNDKETPVENISTNFMTTGKQSEDDNSITPDYLVTTKSNDKLNSTNFDNEIFGARYSKNETDFSTTLPTEKTSQISAIETFINNSLSDIKYWNDTDFVNDTNEDMEFFENEIQKNVNLLENKFKEIENMVKSLHHIVTSTTEDTNAIAPLEIIKSATEYEVRSDHYTVTTTTENMNAIAPLEIIKNATEYEVGPDHHTITSTTEHINAIAPLEIIKSATEYEVSLDDHTVMSATENMNAIAPLEIIKSATEYEVGPDHHTVTSTTEHMNAIAPLEIIKNATEYEVGPDHYTVMSTTEDTNAIAPLEIIKNVTEYEVGPDHYTVMSTTEDTNAIAPLEIIKNVTEYEVGLDHHTVTSTTEHINAIAPLEIIKSATEYEVGLDHHTVTSTTEHINAIAPLEITKSATEYKVSPNEAEVFNYEISVTEGYFTKEVTSHNKSLNLEPTSILEYPTTSSTTVKNVSYINETDIIPLPAHSSKPTDEVLQIILPNETKTKSNNKSHEESSSKLPSTLPSTIRVESDEKNTFEYSTVRDKITNKEFSKTSPSGSNATQVFDYSNLENVLRKVLINKISNHEVSTDTSQSIAKNGENINFGYEPKDKTQYKELPNTSGSATHPIKVSIDDSNLENVMRNLLLHKTYVEETPDLSSEYSTVSANSNDFVKSLPHLTHEANKFGTKSQPEKVSTRGPIPEKKLQQLLLNRTLATGTPTETYSPLRILTNFNPYEQLLSKLYWSMLLENVAKRKQIPIAQIYPTEPILVLNSPKYSDTILERPQVAIKNNEMTTFKPYTANAFKDGKNPIELDWLSDIVFPKKFPAKGTSQFTKEFQPKEAVVAADQTSKTTTTIPKLTTSDWLLQSYLDIKPAIQSYIDDKTDISEKLLNDIRLLGELYSKELPLVKPLITNQSSQATEAEARAQNPTSTTLAYQEIISEVPDAEIDAERETDITEKIPSSEEPTAVTEPMKKAGISPEKPLVYKESTTKIEPEMRTNISYKMPDDKYKNKVDTANLSPVASIWQSLHVWPFQRFFYNKSNIHSYYEKSPTNFKAVYKEKPVQSHRNTTEKTTMHINVCGIDNAPLRTVEQGTDRIERFPWLGVLIYPKDKERLFTTVVLITVQLVVASALDIDKLPKDNFRSSAKVVLGHNCKGPRIGVLNYNYHPDFREGLYNSLALVQIDSAALISRLRPICPPPKILLGPKFYAMVIPEDCRRSNISVYEMMHVPEDTCRRYYTSIGLDIESLWPRYVACGKVRYGGGCVWRNGAILLVKQDFKWHLLGFGVSGPGCEAPSRFVDYGMYSDWVARTVERMGQPAITKIAPNQLIMRRSINQMQRFGLCDPEEMKILIFSDITDIQAPVDFDKHQAGRVQYNLTILSNVDYQCVIFRAYNIKGMEHKDPPKLVLRRYCQSLPSYCFSGPGFIKIDFYLTIYFFHDIRYEIQAYGHETKTVDPKLLTKYTNKKRDYPKVPVWGGPKTRRTRRFKFSKTLEKYKNSFTYEYHKKTGRRSRIKALKKLNEEKQREKEERAKKKKVVKEKYEYLL